jgi:hypothetical protein
MGAKDHISIKTHLILDRSGFLPMKALAASCPLSCALRTGYAFKPENQVAVSDKMMQALRARKSCIIKGEF